MTREPSLARSFMYLSFATAFLMIVFQSRDSIFRSATATSFGQSNAQAQMSQPIQLTIDLSDRKVYLYHKGVLQTSYDIAVGRDGWQTPIGNHQILVLTRNPTWQHPFTGEVIPTGIDNPLGTRWIGFWTDGKHQIGLHGTNEEDLVGQAVSHGCVRMRNTDIEALFSQVSLGTTVVVQP